MSSYNNTYHKECNGCAFWRELRQNNSKPCELRQIDYCPCRICLIKCIGNSNCYCDDYQKATQQYYKIKHQKGT